MPIYEYRCGECHKRSSYLVPSLAQHTAPLCKHCGSARLDRIMSRFAAPKSEEARLEALADPGQLGDLDENDPQSMARFMKKMGKELGEDLGDELDEAMEGAEDEMAGSDAMDMD